MISAGDFKNGVTLEIDGEVKQVIEFQHVKPGKGSPFVRAKLKGIPDGGVTETTFSPKDKFPTAHIDRTDMQYLYTDGMFYYFMDPETYEQVSIEESTLGDALKFLKENMVCKVGSYKGNIFSIELPITVELTVTETEPGFAGNTAQGADKPATVETGAVIRVPLFVNIGDVLQIDTRTGEYLKRV